MENFVFLSGYANLPLARRIARLLKMDLVLESKKGVPIIKCFPDSEMLATLPCDVTGKAVFVLQPISYYVRKGRLYSPNDALMELCQIGSSAMESGADKVTAVIPFYGYARQDRKDESKVPITARLVADMLTKAAGIKQVMLLDLHNGTIQGFFSNMRADHLYAKPVFLSHYRNFFSKEELKEIVVVYPDSGALKYYKDYSKRLKARSQVIDKDRISEDQVEPEIALEELSIIGKKVQDRIVLVHDDMISTGGTIIEVAQTVKFCGARKVYLSAIHPVFSGSSFERFMKAKKQGIIEKVFVSDSIDYLSRIPEDLKKDYEETRLIESISVANLLAEAVARVHKRFPLGPLFEEETRYFFAEKLHE